MMILLVMDLALDLVVLPIVMDPSVLVPVLLHVTQATAELAPLESLVLGRALNVLLANMGLPVQAVVLVLILLHATKVSTAMETVPLVPQESMDRIVKACVQAHA